MTDRSCEPIPVPVSALLAFEERDQPLITDSVNTMTQRHCRIMSLRQPAIVTSMIEVSPAGTIHRAAPVWTQGSRRFA
jgi:hypothetical protein